VRQNPFEIVTDANVAERAHASTRVVTAVLNMYQVVVQQLLRNDCVLLTPNGWVYGEADDPLTQFLVDLADDDIIEIALDDFIERDGDEEVLDLDALAQGILLEGGEGVAFWLPSLGGAVVVPLDVAQDRLIGEPLRTTHLLVNGLAGAGTTVAPEVADEVIGCFWDLVAERGLRAEDTSLLCRLGPRERLVEDWLVEHLDALEVHGYPLVIVPGAGAHGGQFRLGKGVSIADLICRRQPAGGVVVIEIKRGVAGVEVLDQLDRYIDAARTEVAQDRETVEGLIISDGATAALRARLATRPMCSG
jgi:hypothetical protein